MPYDLGRFWANIMAAQACLKTQECQRNLSAITMEDLLLFNRKKLFLGEPNVITLKQQFLCIILYFLCI